MIEYIIFFGVIVLIFIIAVVLSNRSRYRHERHSGEALTPKQKRARKRTTFR